MGGIISYQTLSPFQGWGFYCAIFPGRCPGLSYFAPSGQMQAYRKDSPVPELVEGALTKPQIYTVAHASGSESSVFLPCLMLLLILLISVALLLSFPCFSVLIRGKFFCFCFVFLPWQMLILNSVAHASGSERHVAFVFPKPCNYKGLR